MNRQLFYLFIFSLLSTVSLKAQCPTLSYNASIDVCSGLAPVFTPGATCALTGSGAVFTDLYIYDGGNSPAPVGYENTAIATGTCAADLNPFQDGLLSPVSQGNGCETITGTAVNNSTCDVITVTYLMVASDDGIDDDMDGCFDYIAGCPVARFDVAIYPNFTVETTPGCLPSASLVAADGSVCATQAATTFGDCDTPFTYDFTNYFAGSPATGTGAICQLPPPGAVDFVTDPPTITCPPSVQVECNGSTDPADTGMAVGASNCAGNTVTVDFTDASDQATSGCGLTNYTIVRSWTATDVCGNSVTCTQDIVVTDSELPTINCPANAVVDCNDGVDPSVLGTAFAIDNCTPVADLEIAFFDNTNADDFCNQVITRTWVATDNCGNNVDCEQTITVTVTDPPTITCPPTVQVECGDSTDPADTGMAVGTSNCAGNTVTVDYTDASGQTSFGCGLTNYTIVRSWTATDACGNISATCTQDIIITDTQLPTITCPADATVSCTDSTEPNALGFATATDGCTPDAELQITFSDNAFTDDVCNQTIIRTWVATDNCGGLVTCDQTITLLNNDDPILTSATNMVVECDGGGNINAFNLWLNNNGGVTVVTGSGSTSSPNNAFDCAQQYTITAGDPVVTTDCGGASSYVVEFTAADGCGNSASTTGTFTIEDTDAPVFTTSPISVQVECTGGNPTADFNEWLANNGGAVAEDLCGAITWTTIPANPVLNTTCGGAGNAPVTFVATDDCGNSVSVPAIYIVNDSSAPMFTSFPEDKTQDCDDAPNFNTPSTSDFCSNVTLEFEDVTTEGDCENDFYITRTWTAVDACGNASEPISQTIHFEDNTAPNIYFVDPLLVGIPDGGSITFACDDFSVFSANAVEATDNCSSTFAPDGGPNGDTDGINDTGVFTELDVQIFDAVTFSAEEEEECGPDNLYQQMVCTWTATDACGNEASITIYMNFVDEVAPEFTTVAEDMTVSCGEAIDMTPPTTEDNCSEFVAVTFTDVVTPGCDPGIVTTRTWVATDLCGNFSEMTQVITVIDDVAPAFTSVPENGTVTCGDDVVFDDATAEDSCSDVTVTFTDATSTEGCNNVTTRTWTATDACGNTATAMATITETDDAAPAVTDASDMMSACNDEADALANWLAANGGASATDDCSTVIWSNDYDAANWVDTDCATGAIRTVAVTFTAADACGNMASTTATFSTTDTDAPTFTAVPENGTIACDATPEFGTPVATDDCGDATITSETTSTVNGCETVHTITWTATDACGNTATASQTLTAVDNAAPVFVSVPDASTVTCGATPNWGEPVVSDDCGTATVTFTDSPNPGCNGGTMTRTWTATDACGNTATASATTVMEADNTPPTISEIPSDIIAECNATIPWDIPTVSDNCGGEVTLTHTEVSNGGSCQSGYDITCTWTATDACGNVSTATQVAWVYPEGSSSTMFFTYIPENLTRNCGEPIEFGTPIGTSSCVDFDLTYVDETIAGDCDGTYIMSRNWTATNDCMGTATCTQQITVVDNTAPYFTFVPEGGEFTCDASIEFGTPLCEDNCSHVSQTTFEDVTTATCGASYDVTRTWTITDACGNTNTASATYSVIDTDAPAFNNTLADKQIACGQEMIFDTPAATDQCGGTFDLTFEDQASTDNCAVDYTVTRVWTATDECGNTSNIAQSITRAADTQAPIFTSTPQDYTTNCDTAPVFGTPTVEDNCGQVQMTYTDVNSAGDCASGYTVTRTWTAIDACGNEVTTSQTVTVADDTPTTVAFSNVPADQFINCGDALAFGTPQIATNCADEAVITFEDVTVEGTCAASYAVTRTWTATACDIAITAEATITVEDTQLPAFDMVPDNKVIACGENAAFDTPLFSDNCSAVELTFTDATNTNNCEVATTRTWTIADACGNVATAAQTITSVDDQIPAFDMVPENKVIACGENAAFDTPLFSDNCSAVELTFTDATNTNNCEVATTRTWTIADACGNVATAAQTITSVDTDAPVFTSTPQDYVTNCDTAPAFGTPVVEDNCGQVNLTFNDETSIGDCSTGYTVTRTWTAIDECGNEVTISQTVTVVDNTETTVAFSNIPADQFINCGDALAFGNPEIATNCADEAVITFEDVTVEGSCAASYAITRTWTATACNITVTADATITVEDTQLPNFDMVPDNKVIACGETPAFDAPLYSDNCSAVELTFTDATNTNNCEVATTRTWTIADACGNVATAAQTITSVDTDAPVFTSTPQDYVTNCDTAPAFGTPVVEDNCGQVNLTFNDETSIGDCSTGYTVTRTWTAIDECGNEVTTSQTVTVADDTETTVAFSNVPADQFINCGDALAFGTPEIATNCADEAVITFEDATVQGTCASSYAVTRTWTATACNITVTAEATITVEDSQIPTFDTTPTDKFVACGETMEFDTPLFSDNCSEVTISHTDATNNNSCETGMVMTRTWTIADACGNVANIAQTITREADAVAPTFTQIPQGGNVTCDGNFEFGEPVVADNCSEVNVTFEDNAQEGSCELGYSFTRTWTAADACGNVATAQQTFVIENDNTAPAFTFVPADEQLTCVANPVFGEATALDACSNVELTFEDVIENTDCSAAQVYTRIWTAIDGCGNASQAQQVLTVMPDTDAPIFSFVPEDEVVDCDVIIEDNFGTPEAMDNCGSALTTTFEDVTAQLECGIIVTRTWSVADACGNVATASKSITVQDNAQPTIVFAPENKVISCGTEIPLEDASFADNCDADFDVTFEETTEQVTCGYILHRTWTAVDNCANVTEVSQTIEVTDNVAPLFDLVPTDQPMSYDAFANWTAPEVTAQDDCSSATVTAPVITNNDDCDNFKYFVTWTANDDCGNATEHTMTIPITDAIMEVSLDAPAALLEGNDEVLVANVEFGLAPYTYDWTILEGQGWTLDADGNLANISAGNQDATFEVRVTDAHGCSNTTVIDVTATPTTITTEFFEILPNPTYGDLNINYTSEFDAQSRVTVYDMLGRKLHTWKFDAVQGINNNNIDVRPLADATYVITVEVGERLYHQKFVKLAN